jgi:hypothetical protein
MSSDDNLATYSGHVVHPPLPYDLRGRSPFYDGGELSNNIPYFSTGGSTIACHRRPTPDGTLTRLTLSSCWLTPWPPGPQSTGAQSSLLAVTLAPRSQPIY